MRSKGKIKVTPHRIIVIAHGKTELIFAHYIRSSLRIKVDIFSNNKGKSSIQINGLVDYLNNNFHFREREFKKEYFSDIPKREWENLVKIFPIMDLDDCSQEKKQKYQNSELFKDLWFKPYIVPIWNCPNFESPMLQLGINVEKKSDYINIFPINNNNNIKAYEEISDLHNKLKELTTTNMDDFLKYCMKVATDVDR